MPCGETNIKILEQKTTTEQHRVWSANIPRPVKYSVLQPLLTHRHRRDHTQYVADALPPHLVTTASVSTAKRPGAVLHWFMVISQAPPRPWRNHFPFFLTVGHQELQVHKLAIVLPSSVATFFFGHPAKRICLITSVCYCSLGTSCAQT